jgi:formiminoglutamase
MKNLPILIIIPHGGIQVPDEIIGHESADSFERFMESDAGAIGIFNFKNMVSAVIDSPISKLFVDLDRNPNAGIKNQDWIIKKSTSYNRPVFIDGIFPDDIAISNIIRRYHTPFHDAIKKILSTGHISCIIECHTMAPLAPPSSYDSGEHKPLVLIEPVSGTMKDKCFNETALRDLLQQMGKSLYYELKPVTRELILRQKPAQGYILEKYSGTIPFLRLSLSRTLILTEPYFNIEKLIIDDNRLKQIRKIVFDSLLSWYSRFH